MASAQVARRFAAIGGRAVPRQGVVTDNGGAILDVHGLVDRRCRPRSSARSTSGPASFASACSRATGRASACSARRRACARSRSDTKKCRSAIGRRAPRDRGRKPRNLRPLHVSCGPQEGWPVAKPNYSFEKRQRELAKKKKKEQKEKDKADRKVGTPGDGDAAAPDDAECDSGPARRASPPRAADPAATGFAVPRRLVATELPTEEARRIDRVDQVCLHGRRRAGDRRGQRGAIRAPPSRSRATPARRTRRGPARAQRSAAGRGATRPRPFVRASSRAGTAPMIGRRSALTQRHDVRPDTCPGSPRGAAPISRRQALEVLAGGRRRAPRGRRRATAPSTRTRPGRRSRGRT